MSRWIAVVLAVVLVAGAFLAVGQLRQRDRRMAELEAQLAESTARAKALEQSEAEARNMATQETTRLEAELEQTRNRLQAVETPAAAVASEPAPTEEVTEETPATEEAGADKDTPPLVAMMKGLKDNEGMSNMMVNMQYGRLFKDLNLPKDLEDRVRAILGRGAQQELDLGMKALQGGEMDPKAAQSEREALQAELREELSRYLSADEVAVWEDYETNKQRYMMEQSFDMQLGMFAPDLEQENRTRVSQVLAEEVATIQQNGSQDMTQSIDLAIQAYERARERLYQELPEESLGGVDRFIDQMVNITRSSAEMMQGLMGGNSTTNAPAAATTP